MRTSFTFEIPGKPTAWARARTNGKRHFNSAKHEAGMQGVAVAFLAAAPDWTPWEGPVRLTVEGWFQPPKAFWGQDCTKKPDLDNLLKLVGDALNGVAYRDDSQVIEATVRKAFTVYGHEKTLVKIEFLPAVVKQKKTKKETK